MYIGANEPSKSSGLKCSLSPHLRPVHWRRTSTSDRRGPGFQPAPCNNRRWSGHSLGPCRGCKWDLSLHEIVIEVQRRRHYRLNMTNELSKTNVLEYEAPSPADSWRSGNLVLTGFASTRPITSAQMQLVSAPNKEIRGKSNTRDAKAAVESNVGEVSSTAPLRLAVAAKLAFPAGGLTAAGLRREAAKGRLAIERIAGKDYTTLVDIEEMRALCRTNPRALDSGSGPQRGCESTLDHQRRSEADSHRMRRWRSPRS
jgi:hypothetical protein